MKPKVTIQYGIFGSQKLGKRFRVELERAGYDIVFDPTQADIIVAHSAGCFWLPEAPTKQWLLLIDPPYWPGRTVAERGQQRVKSNFHYRKFGYPLNYWLLRNSWSFFYAIRDFRQTQRIVKHAQHYDLAKIIKNHKAVLIRNEHDDWLTPDLDQLQIANPKLIIKQLPGDHDDCWYNPKPYVDLLQLLR